MFEVICACILANLIIHRGISELVLFWFWDSILAAHCSNAVHITEIDHLEAKELLECPEKDSKCMLARK